MSNRLYDFAGEIRHETDAAVLIEDGENKVWLPKSQVQDNNDGTFTIPEWLAVEKEMV